MGNNITKKKYRLPKAFGEKWVAALRSGKYKQYEGGLTNCEGAYCCLGVAAHLAGESDEKIEHYALIEPHFSEMIPRELVGYAVQKHENFNELVGMLAYRNDGTFHQFINPNNEKFNFKQIADWLEQNVEFYETTE
jgi:hypothetical protein